MDQQKLKLLMHNAAIYGVAERIVPICCDYFQLADWLRQPDKCGDALGRLFAAAVAINISPPWGGPQYLSIEAFDIDEMDFDRLMDEALALSPNVCCFVPRHSNCHQIIRSWSRRREKSLCGKLEIEQNCVQNKVKAVSIYTGQLVLSPDLGLM